jgi:hypothetical protein
MLEGTYKSSLFNLVASNVDIRSFFTLTTWFCVASTVPIFGESTAVAAEYTADVTNRESNALVHEVTFVRNGPVRKVAGRLLLEFHDQLVIQTDDGAIYTIYQGEIQNHLQTDRIFRPATSEEIAERLLAEMPSGFRIHTTSHYVVCYGTSRTYAQWTSSLLERLHRAFTRYWSRHGFQLHEPEFPLVALVFPDQKSYLRSAKEQGAQISSAVVGFYSLQSNRVNMYDLTGVEAVRSPGNRRGSLKEISQMLSVPAAVPLVSTIVHEATHQIAFNCGLQTRLSDIPLWLCEGMAIVFETPDLSSTKGWRGIGKVNYPRLKTYRKNQKTWRTARLKNMLASDRLFRDSRTAANAYADAWALNYYLIKYHPEAYTAYLKLLAQKPRLGKDGPERRLEEFHKSFGEIGDLERDFLKQMAKIKS